MYNSKIAYKNDGLITERDLLDEGLTLTSWDPLGCFNSYIYSPIEGIDICRSLPLYKQTAAQPLTPNNETFNTANLLKALWVLNKHYKIGRNPDKGSFYTKKADILITLSLEEKVRLEGFQYPNYEEDADLTQQEIEELREKGPLLPLYKTTNMLYGEYSYHGLVSDDFAKKELLKRFTKAIPWKKPNHNNKSWETEIDWAKELLHNFDIDYQTKENIVDKKFTDSMY